MHPERPFRSASAFGYAETCNTRLDYRQVRATEPADLWIDDPAHADYNLWVQGPTTAKSYERLRREDGAYEFAIVIEYNTAVIERGKGSAIFLHVWDARDRGTAGCVAVARKDMQMLLEWFDPACNPVIEIVDR